jgi:hypothetical protein
MGSITREALGDIFDIGLCWAPVDLNTADGATGKRIALSAGRGLSIVVIKAAGTAADDFTYTLQQHTAYTGGTSGTLVGIDHYYLKSEAVLDNDETWAVTSQSLAGTIVDTSRAQLQTIMVIPVHDALLTEGYTHVSLNAAATVANAQLATAIYIVHSLKYRRRPDRLPNLLNPGAANA